ncbi:MAG TPA: hypothetical protein DDZ51_14295 [Planctomycetaceae bacterium]|nr:hypothetical protein [Planctomycetaceae bacterium]
MIQSLFHVYIYGPDGGPLASRFEDVSDRLSQVDRLHMELDGSFVWVGPNWQLDGMIYDHADRIRYIDLKGHCQLQQWQTLMRWIADPMGSGSREFLTVWGAQQQVLHDLQSFEAIVWPA